MQRKLIKNLMLVLTLVVLCLAVGVTASALDATGQCGDNVYWNFDETTGELVISGEGDMWDYDISSYNIGTTSPFYDAKIKKVVVGKDITSIGEHSFFGADFLEEVIFEDCSLEIKYEAFGECFALGKIDFGEGIIIVGELGFEGAAMVEELYLPSNVKELGAASFYTYPVLKKVYVEGVDTIINDYALCVTTAVITGMAPLEYVEKFKTYISMTDREAAELLWEELDNAVDFVSPYFYGTIYAHTGSTAEAYATTNEINFVATHFFDDDWTYDYENMIRTRKCIHCDVTETEAIEPEVPVEPDEPDTPEESDTPDVPTTPDEPQEETKDNFFSKIFDLINSFFELIMSWFNK